MKRNKNRLTELEIRGFKSISYQHPLTLRFGDINILLGANGAGKSTTVKMLSGIMRPTSGEILIDGVSPQREQTRNSSIMAPNARRHCARR